MVSLIAVGVGGDQIMERLDTSRSVLFLRRATHLDTLIDSVDGEEKNLKARKRQFRSSLANPRLLTI